MSVLLTKASDAGALKRPSDPSLLTRDEAAAFLGVSVSCLAHWSSAGAGPTFARLGRRTWYRIADLNDWVANQIPARFSRVP